MITEAVKEALPAGKGAEVTIAVPEGEKVAEKTLNAKLGIVGGISILGTTGRVEPWSVEAMRDSLVPQVGVARGVAGGVDSSGMNPGAAPGGPPQDG